MLSALAALLSTHSRKKRASLILVASAFLVAALPVLAAGESLGRRVSEVLTELRGQGLVFIYNTQTIDDKLRVTREPRANTGIELAREILAEHGLALLPVAPNTFSVVKSQASARPRTDQATGQAIGTTTLAEVVVQTSRYTLASDLSGSHALLTQEQVKNLPRLGDETLRAIQRLLQKKR